MKIIAGGLIAGLLFASTASAQPPAGLAPAGILGSGWNVRDLEGMRAWYIDKLGMKQVGIDAIAWGFSGPMIRAAGIPWDLRRSQPYEVYDRMEFDMARKTASKRRFSVNTRAEVRAKICTLVGS